MSAERITDAKKRLLERLKRSGPATAGALATAAGLTDVAVRQHLLALEALDLVRQDRREPQGRGRPSMVWSLTPLAAEVFPDRHAELTVGLIEATRRAVGEDGLARIIEARATEQVKQYRKLVPESESLKRRVAALARQRTDEGYMAEVVDEGQGRYLLVEHHCPICDAARTCTGLCGAELDVFRETLGKDTEVERVSHLLSGDDRCAYRIRRAANPNKPKPQPG